MCFRHLPTCIHTVCSFTANMVCNLQNFVMVAYNQLYIFQPLCVNILMSPVLNVNNDPSTAKGFFPSDTHTHPLR